MDDNTAAALQMEYDLVVHEFGPDSPEAIEAEQAARYFFTNTRFDGRCLYPQLSPSQFINFTGTSSC